MISKITFIGLLLGSLSLITFARASEYGPIGSGDNLWRIAKTMKAVPSLSTAQRVQLLYKSNPHAFINKDINRLKQGAILQLPNPKTSTLIPQFDVVVNQDASTVVVTASELVPMVSLSSENILPKPILKVQTIETVTMLEKTNAIPAIGSVAALEKAKTSLVTTQRAEPPISTGVGTLMPTDPAITASVATIVESASESVGIATKPGAPATKIIVPQPIVSLANGIMLVSILFAILCLTGGLLFFFRSQRTQIQVAVPSSPDSTKLLLEQAQQEVVEGSYGLVCKDANEKASKQEVVKPLLKESITELLERAAQAAEKGNYGSAKTIIHRAIIDRPTDLQMRLKLLVVEYAQRDIESFVMDAGELYAHLSSSDTKIWGQVLAMAKNLCPNEPLFNRLAEEGEPAAAFS